VPSKFKVFRGSSPHEKVPRGDKRVTGRAWQIPAPGED
jgi:hypothetical protein